MGDSTFAEGYAIGRDSNNTNGNGMFGGDWAWWIVILLIFGWGNGGFGGYGNGGAGVQGALTRGDLCQDMNFSDLESAVRGVNQGLCDGFYAMNTGMLNGFGGVQQTLCQGFSGVNTAIERQGYESRLATQGLSSQLASCCCDLRAGQADIKYQMATDTCAIKQAIADNTQAVLGFLTQEKISALQAENALLTSQLSQNSQTRTIIEALQPVAKPAYITCSPYESSYGFYGNRSGYGYNNNGCGCGCGCNG